MARRHPVLRGFLYLAGVGVLFVAAVSLYTYLTAGGFALIRGNAVAVVMIEGVISESEEVVDTLDRIGESNSIRAVVLRVDSPGGEVAPSQEIYDAVWRLRERKPVVASLGNLAASGGYYVAAASDAIVANAGTLTGSIGVLMEVGNLEELLEKIGLSATILKAGQYKDIGSPIRPMTAEERTILEDLLRNVHEQFIGAVARGRRLAPEVVRGLADGRIYSGEQALEVGLVDRLGGLRDAVELAAERAGIEGKPSTVPFRRDRSPWWWRRLFGLLGGSGSGSGGLRFLYNGPLAPG